MKPCVGRFERVADGEYRRGVRHRVADDPESDDDATVGDPAVVERPRIDPTIASTAEDYRVHESPSLAVETVSPVERAPWVDISFRCASPCSGPIRPGRTTPSGSPEPLILRPWTE
ncbi:hypothetical protein DMJ13_23590 [halophilic archaeon]|nr:hypothetical protein DMJ13_23590 [halophilic archaeon]